MKLVERLFWAWLMFAAMVGFPRQALARTGEAEEIRNQAAADTLFTNGIPHRLKIEIPRAGVRSLQQDPRAYVKATLREGTIVYSNILIRLKGGAGSFRGLDDKPGFSLKLEKNDVFHGLSKFHLNNSVQDDTYLSEWICSEMFRAAEVPAARAAHAVVELNGRPLGFYVLVESVNQEFLARYSQNPRGNVYGQSSNADITEPLERMGGNENTNRVDLRALAAVCRETEVERLRVRLPQVLDLERFLSFMAMEAMLGHWDGYTRNMKNYMVYHDLDTDKMIFIPHDLDQILRSTNEPIVPRAKGTVARAVLRVPDFRERYRQRFAELYTNVFEAPILMQRIDDRAALLASQLRASNPDLAQELVHETQSLKSRILSRAQNLAMQLNQPEPGIFEFVDSQVPLRGWRVAGNSGNAKLAETQDATGKKAFWIAATGPTAASWRLKLVLAAGRYVFEGVVRAAGVKPVSNETKGKGAGLRISGAARSAGLVGDSPGTQMLVEFQVTEAEAEIELICELRAAQGEAWFDATSLRLIRR